MPMKSEAKQGVNLVTSREPVGPDKGSNKTVGDQAFIDACFIIGAAWVILFVLAYSLRAHNI